MPTLVDSEAKLKFGPAEPGCILYLPGLPGGDSQLYDRSPYGNQGTITGASWVRLPSGLWCLSFDGQDDYLGIPDNALWDLSGDFTLEVWVKRAETGVSHGIITHNLESANKKQWSFYVSSAGDVVKFVASTDGINWDITPAASTESIPANQWCHLALTRRGSDYQIYINTLADGSGSDANPFFEVDVALTVGAVDPDRAYLKGKIAFPCLYKRALSQLEFQNHFSREKHLFGVW